MSYVMAVQTYRNGNKNFQWSMESPTPSDCWNEIKQSDLVSGTLISGLNRIFSSKPNAPLSLAHRWIMDGQDSYLYVWLISNEHKPHLETALYQWRNNRTDIIQDHTEPQITYENIMANFYQNLAKSYAEKLAEQSKQMDLLKDNIGNDESWNEGYEAGKNDGILIVSREMETSVANKKAWRVNPHKGVEAWQSLYAEQLAVSESLKMRNSELHQLISALIEARPIHDGIRKQLISRLHDQAQQIAMLQSELDTYDGIDYGVVIHIARQTEIDVWWNKANFTERHNMINAIINLVNGINEVKS